MPVRTVNLKLAYTVFIIYRRHLCDRCSASSGTKDWTFLTESVLSIACCLLPVCKTVVVYVAEVYRETN